MFSKIISAKRALGSLVLFFIFAGLLSCANNTTTNTTTNTANNALSNTDGTEVKGTRGYIEERYKPVQPYNGPQRTGAIVYADYCATCHDRTTQGAPLPDDDIEWTRRLNKQGQATLVKHVMEGYKELMPEKGGCRNCSDQEVLLAIDFIYKSSGIKLEKSFAK